MKKTKPSAPAPNVQALWLTGLDVFSQATKAATEAAALAATQAANQAASHVASLAANAAVPPSLEGLFEARVAKALARLGSPTRAEVQALTAQVEHLQASLSMALQLAERLAANAPDQTAQTPRAKTKAKAKAPATTKPKAAPQQRQSRA